MVFQSLCCLGECRDVVVDHALERAIVFLNGDDAFELFSFVVYLVVVPVKVDPASFVGEAAAFYLGRASVALECCWNVGFWGWSGSVLLFHGCGSFKRCTR